MMINLMQAIYLNDEQFQAEMAKRRERPQLKAGTDRDRLPALWRRAGSRTAPRRGPELSRPRSTRLQQWMVSRCWPSAFGGDRSAGASAQESFSTGQNIAPVYEGWEKNADGSFNLVFGT